MADQAFISGEVGRYNELLKHAGDRWGGGREHVDRPSDLWLDFDRTDQQHSRRSSSGGGSNGTVLNWLSKQNSNK
jgi:hypothetical protein